MTMNKKHLLKDFDDRPEKPDYAAPHSAVLWVCPYCKHARVSTHPDRVIRRNVEHGSKRQRLTAICKNEECTGIGTEAGFRRRRSTSRGGRPTVNLNSRRQSHIEALVPARHVQQVKRLREIAEAHNIGVGIGEPMTITDRMNAWSLQVSRAPYSPENAPPMPWRRWNALNEGGV